MATWKRDFASGLIILVPVIVTLWVVIWLYNFIAGTPFLAVIDEGLLATVGLAWATDFVRVVLTLVVFGLLVLGIGQLMRTAFGNVVESTIDQVINHLPGLRVIYNASKMAAETALTGTDSLQTPVKVEPWEGMRMTAFKTGKRSPEGREILFMPTAPNITTGFVIEVESENVVETDERVEEALTRLLSAGFGDDRRSSHQPTTIPVTQEERISAETEEAVPAEAEEKRVPAEPAEEEPPADVEYEGERAAAEPEEGPSGEIDGEPAPAESEEDRMSAESED